MTAIHPQTSAAWARAAIVARMWWIAESYAREGLDPDTFVRRHGVGALAFLGVRVDVRPHDPQRARYDRAWDRIEADYARRPRTALWWEEGLGAVETERRERAERARQEAALAEVRERLSRQKGASPEARARAWLDKADAGSSYAASRAVLHVVRGFALGATEGRALVVADYVPRFYRKLVPGELDGWVRRAMSASLPWGWMLTKDREARR